MIGTSARVVLFSLSISTIILPSATYPYLLTSRQDFQWNLELFWKLLREMGRRLWKIDQQCFPPPLLCQSTVATSSGSPKLQDSVQPQWYGHEEVLSSSSTPLLLMGMPTYFSDDKSVQYNIVTIRMNRTKLPLLQVKNGKLAKYDAG